MPKQLFERSFQILSNFGGDHIQVGQVCSALEVIFSPESCRAAGAEDNVEGAMRLAMVPNPFDGWLRCPTRLHYRGFLLCHSRFEDHILSHKLRRARKWRTRHGAQ